MQAFAVESLEARRLLAGGPAGYIDEAWGGAIVNATAMEFAPDGRLFVLTQNGTVRIIDASGNLLPDPALTLAVSSQIERGLLGIAFDPAFGSNHYVYLYYTTPSPATNRIARFRVTGDTIDAASRADIFELGAASDIHQGGAIHFGADGMLYAGRGESGTGANSQSIDNLLGKIIRINPAAYDPADPLAIIPADNPTSFPGIAGTTTGANRAIWAVGLRNPFTFAVHPTTGRILINDVGAASYEEINEGLAGRNYGWPATEGGFDPTQFPDFTPPLYYYGRTGMSGGTTIAGGAFYVSDAPNPFLPVHQGKYFFADFGRRWIGYIDPDAPPATHTTHTIFTSGDRRIVDLNVGADGALYYLGRAFSSTGEGGVRRIVKVPTAPTATIHAPTAYQAGNTIHFSGTATDPEQGTLPPSAFSWRVDFHLGNAVQTILGPLHGVTSGSFQVPAAGDPSPDQFYAIHLTVTDDGGLQDSTIRSVRPDVVDITLQSIPLNVMLYVDGQPRATPVSVPGVVGSVRTVAAPSNHLHNGQWHEFFLWSDNGARAHEIIMPALPQTYTAVYLPDTAAPNVTSSRFEFDGAVLPGSPHRIRISFSEDVSASLHSADLALVNTTTGDTIPADQLALAWDGQTSTATFAYVGGPQPILPDGDYTATLLAADVTDPPGHSLAGDHALAFRVLAGDANNDGRVDIDDFKILLTNFGQPNATFSQGDFSYDGHVNLADFNILASRFGVVLGPAPARGADWPDSQRTDEPLEELIG